MTEFNAGEVDGVGGKLGYDGRELDFDLLVTIPLHGGAAYVERSPGLGDALGFVPTDKRTLQTPVKPNVFALGDATDLPTSKAGSVTHFEAEVLTENIARHLADQELDDGDAQAGRCSRLALSTTRYEAAATTVLLTVSREKIPANGHVRDSCGPDRQARRRLK